eukprot:3176764-Rhodomonas_salina.1
MGSALPGTPDAGSRAGTSRRRFSRLSRCCSWYSRYPRSGPSTPGPLRSVQPAPRTRGARRRQRNVDAVFSCHQECGQYQNI